MPEIREAQAQLAREAGIEAFCYYHYWFGNGKRLLERPFEEVVKSGEPDYPFCLAWANHSWYKKLWDPKAPGKDLLLIEQTYPGVEDYINHFNALLPAFQDSRYFRVDGKIFFVIYDPMGFNDVENFISTWRDLARKNNLKDFYFVGTDYDCRNKETIIKKGFDATYNHDTFNVHHHLSKVKKGLLWAKRTYLHRPTVFSYKNAIKYMVTDDCASRDTIPMIVPNWDHSPRSGHNAIILSKSTPELFKSIAKRAIEVVKNKPSEEQIVIIKSWNEWGEGNYMEPDIEFGHDYLKALKEAIEESSC
jgi:hypothetical protein